MVNELIKNKIVQSNDLVMRTNWNLNKTQLDLFKLCVSLIDTKKPSNKITINKNDLVNFFNEKPNSKIYSYLKNELSKLITRVKIIDDEKRTVYVPLVNKIEWSNESDDVMVQFTNDLMPFLIDLKENFLCYEIGIIRKFKSKYSLIIYELLLANYNRYKAHQQNQIIEIKLDELRNSLNCENKLKQFGDLKNKVLNVAMEEINNCITSKIVFFYEPQFKGRKVKSIKFHVRAKVKASDNNFFDVPLVMKPFEEWEI